MSIKLAAALLGYFVVPTIATYFRNQNEFNQFMARLPTVQQELNKHPGILAAYELALQDEAKQKLSQGKQLLTADDDWHSTTGTDISGTAVAGYVQFAFWDQSSCTGDKTLIIGLDTDVCIGYLGLSYQIMFDDAQCGNLRVAFYTGSSCGTCIGIYNINYDTNTCVSSATPYDYYIESGKMSCATGKAVIDTNSTIASYYWNYDTTCGGDPFYFAAFTNDLCLTFTTSGKSEFITCDVEHGVVAENVFNANQQCVLDPTQASYIYEWDTGCYANTASGIESFSSPVAHIRQMVQEFYPLEDDYNINPPTRKPTGKPTQRPTSKMPTWEPTTSNPTLAPSAMPTTLAPTLLPTATPTVLPSAVPTAVPTPVPTFKPSAAPTVLPTVEPTVIPTIIPTVIPTVIPSVAPSALPSAAPSIVPTLTPTVIPTIIPTVTPSVVPTALPSTAPSAVPTVAPTAKPSAYPSVMPTLLPTVVPTAVPTLSPSAAPSVTPTIIPTVVPTVTPSAAPTAKPSPAPSAMPTVAPTTAAVTTVGPTAVPTFAPSYLPTPDPSGPPFPNPFPNTYVKLSCSNPESSAHYAPTAAPFTSGPSRLPTLKPTGTPTNTAQPSRMPTVKPSLVPTALPSKKPSVAPTIPHPTIVPTVAGSTYPPTNNCAVRFNVVQVVIGISVNTWSLNVYNYNMAFMQAIALSIGCSTANIINFVVVATVYSPNGQQQQQGHLRALNSNNTAVSVSYTVETNHPNMTYNSMVASIDESVETGQFNTWVGEYAVEYDAMGLVNTVSEVPMTTDETSNINNLPSSDNSNDATSSGTVAGAVIGALAGCALFAALAYYVNTKFLSSSSSSPRNSVDYEANNRTTTATRKSAMELGSQQSASVVAEALEKDTEEEATTTVNPLAAASTDSTNGPVRLMSVTGSGNAVELSDYSGSPTVSVDSKA